MAQASTCQVPARLSELRGYFDWSALMSWIVCRCSSNHLQITVAGRMNHLEGTNPDHICPFFMKHLSNNKCFGASQALGLCFNSLSCSKEPNRGLFLVCAVISHLPEADCHWKSLLCLQTFRVFSSSKWVIFAYGGREVSCFIERWDSSFNGRSLIMLSEVNRLFVQDHLEKMTKASKTAHYQGVGSAWLSQLYKALSYG